MEPVRYIHLNPIRAGLVPNLKTLDRYADSGHSTIMGNQPNSWQDKKSVLGHFSKKRIQARRQYRTFVQKGVGQGRRPELSGGGLIRSVGGWGVLKSKRRMKEHIKGDERIPIDSDFVESVLSEVCEKMERRYLFQSKGITIDTVIHRAGALFDIQPEDDVCMASKNSRYVQARSIAVY